MYKYSSLIELAGPSYFFIPLLLGFLCIAATAVIAVGYLTKGGRKKAAAAIIMVMFLLGTGNAVYLSIYTEDATGGSGTFLIWDDVQSMDSIGEINYVPDKKGNILAFGKLKITTGNSPEYVDLEFDQNHQLTGSPEAMKYKKAIETSLEDEGKNSIVGKSLPADKLNQFYEKERTSRFSISTFFLQFLLNNILTIVLVLIYFAINYRVRRRKANKMDSSKIQDL